MDYLPGTTYYGEFTTSHPLSGGATDADSPPTALASRDGVDDPSFVLTVSHLDTGRYAVSGVIPSTYLAGDQVSIVAGATVGGILGTEVIDTLEIAGSIVAIQGGLVTADQVIEAGRDSNPNIANRTDLSALISRATARIQKYCGRTFGPQVIVGESYDGLNLPRIWLRQTPVVRVNKITINGELLDNTNGDRWVVDRRTGMLTRGQGTSETHFQSWFPSGESNILVDYEAGESVPDDVQHACILTVLYYIGLYKAPGHLKGEKLGDYSYEVSASGRFDLPDVVRSILGQYILDLAI